MTNKTNLCDIIENAGPCQPDETCVAVTPGICGFECRIIVRRIDKRSVALAISDSECRQIQQLAEQIRQMSLKELFMPLTRNPVYIAAEKSGCHPSCVIPAAVLKTVEVALEMALPRPVCIQFVNQEV